MAHAQPINQNCKDLAKKMIRADFQINQIQKQMTNAIGNVYGEANKQEQKSKNNNKLMDRHNRHVNILIHNLGRQTVNMQGLLKNAKQQANNCQGMVREFSDKVNSILDIHAEMERSIANPNTSEHEFQDLIKNLKQQASGTNSELQSAVR